MDVITLIIEVFQKATLTVNNTPIESQWRVIYSSNVTSEWKDNNSSIILDYGLYTIEFSDVNGYVKPDNYQIYLNPGESKKIQTIYTLNNELLLTINFTIPTQYQKYLSWRLLQLQDNVIVEWNNQTQYISYLQQGNYQLQISDYISDITQNAQIYDYLTGDIVSISPLHIVGENIDINLISATTITRNYLANTNISPGKIVSATNCSNVCVTIEPQQLSDLIQWRLVSSNNTTNSTWFSSGKTVQVPYGTYYVVTTPISGWYVTNVSNLITVSSDQQITLVGIHGQINGNLRIKLDGDSIVKNKGRWRVINTETWYMDNEEISLPSNSYEIEFLEIDNYSQPDNTFYYVTAYLVNIFTASYVSLGTLQINITADTILESFGTPNWKLSGTSDWQITGATLHLIAGTYTVQFNTVGNIYTHPDIDVIITNEQAIVETITFIGTRLFIVPTKTGINFYNYNNLSPLNILPQMVSQPDTNQIAFNNDSTLLAIANNHSPYLVIYDLINYNLYEDANFIPPLGGCRSLDFSNDGNYLAVSHNNFPYLTVYNVSDWSTVTLTTLPSDYCNSVKFSHDSSYLTIGFDQSPYLIVYDTTTF